MLSLVLLLAACAAVVYALRNHLTTYLHHLDTIIFPTAKRDLTQQTPSLRGTFWSLPPELRDEIFNLAYAPTTPSPSIKLIPITTWIEKERRRRDYAWDTRADKAPALPVCPLDFMLVSRQFYREATATWFRLRTVHMKYLAELDRIISRDLRRCVVAVEMEWDHYIYSNVNNFNEMKACCSLRKVRIAMKVSWKKKRSRALADRSCKVGVCNSLHFLSGDIPGPI